jgi:hypothetical protein
MQLSKMLICEEMKFGTLGATAATQNIAVSSGFVVSVIMFIVPSPR